MNTKIAVHDEGDSAGSGSWKAPSRDLNSASRSASADGEGAPLVWDTYPPTAGKDQKLSHGSEQSSDESARCAAGFVAGNGAGFSAESGGFSLLDSLKNNRNSEAGSGLYSRPLGRGKFCGRWSVKGTDPKTGRTVHRRVNCGSWNCSYCGPRKARTARAAIRRVAEDLGLKYFLTLTLDPSKLESKIYAVPYLRECFNKFRIYLKRKYGVAPSYVCVVEFTKAGVPHLHILFDRYIEQRWISKAWDTLGGGRIVFIKQVSVKNVARYLSKYLTKELLLSAPKGTRRITTARSIKLFPKFDSGITWELIHESIWRALEQCRMRDYSRQEDLFKYISVQLDEEKFLKAFELVADA